MLDIGERLSTYEPLWENWYKDGYVGGGNFGKVYRLKQNFYGETRYSAVKIIPIILEKELLSSNKDRTELIERKKAERVQEIKNMYKLKGQKSLVQCLAHSIKDIYNDNGEIVGFDILIQMDYYTSLVNYTASRGVLTADQVEKLAAQIASGIRSMHEINMLHRDIKIDNIFVDKNGDYMLGDFGISKQESLSSYSTMAGTPPFIAPEVWKVQNTNKRYTKTADIYSFGISLYYLLNGNKLPLVEDHFTQNQIDDMVFERLNGRPFPKPMNGSERLKSIVMRCCAYEAQDRFQSMEDVISALNDSSYAQLQSADKYATMYAGTDNISEREDPYATQYAGSTGMTDAPSYTPRSMGSYERQTPYSFAPQSQPQPQYQPQYQPQPKSYSPRYEYDYEYENEYESPKAENAGGQSAVSGVNKTIFLVTVIGTLCLIIMILLIMLVLFNDPKDRDETVNTITTRATTTDPDIETSLPQETTAVEDIVTEETDDPNTVETVTTKKKETRAEAVYPESKDFQGNVYVLADLKYDGLNMRKGPSTEYGVAYDSIPRGGQAEKYAEALDDEDGKEYWSYLRYVDLNGSEHYGWCLSKYLSDSPTIVQPDYMNAPVTKQVATKEDPLNIRSGPGYDYKILWTIPRGDNVTMYSTKYNSGEDRTFAYVCYSGTKWGWVNCEYLNDPGDPLPKPEKKTTKKKTTTEAPEPDFEFEDWEMNVKSVSCSSNLKRQTNGDKVYTYVAENLVDGDLSTSWTEGVDGSGIDEWIQIDLEEKDWISEIYFANGYLSSEKSYKNNNRVKKCLVEFSDGSSYKFTLEDSYDLQPDILEIPDMVETDYIRITILDVYKGSKYNDTCISEIQVRS